MPWVVLALLLASAAPADTLLDFEEVVNLPDYTPYEGKGFVVEPVKGPDVYEPTFIISVTLHPGSGGAYNGTNVLRALVNTQPRLTRENGGTFDISGFDLSEYSRVFPTPLTLTVHGLYAGGGSTETVVVTDGFIDGTGGDDDFEHFPLDDAWKNLVRVSFTAPKVFALDNLELTKTDLLNRFLPALSPGAHGVLAGAIAMLGVVYARRSKMSLPR